MNHDPRIEYPESSIDHPESSIFLSLSLLFLSSVICLLASAERSEVPARRETIYIQNKPNLRKAQMNVTSVTIANYEEIRPPNPAKAKPMQTKFNTIKANQSQFQTQFPKCPKMNVTKVLTTDYENKRLRRASMSGSGRFRLSSGGRKVIIGDAGWNGFGACVVMTSRKS